jgi:hypothetical protein
MKPATLLMVLLVSVILIVLAAEAQQLIYARVSRPNHVMANTNRTCLPGYSRLFGSNPPVCFQNCPPGWSLYSHHISGAKCVICPVNYVIRHDPVNDVYTCVRAFTGGGGDGPPVGGGTFGQ